MASSLASLKIRGRDSKRFWLLHVTKLISFSMPCRVEILPISRIQWAANLYGSLPHLRRSCPKVMSKTLITTNKAKQQTYLELVPLMGSPTGSNCAGWAAKTAIFSLPGPWGLSTAGIDTILIICFADGQSRKHDAHPRVCSIFWVDCGLVPLKTSARGNRGEKSYGNQPQFVCHAG